MWVVRWKAVSVVFRRIIAFYGELFDKSGSLESVFCHLSRA